MNFLRVLIQAGSAILGKVKITDGTEDVNVDTSNRLETAVLSLKPDGTNVMRSLDVAARRGYVQLNDGTTSATVTAQAQLRTRSMPTKGVTTIHKAQLAIYEEDTIYTVTAGKTFYLVGAHLAGRSRTTRNGYPTLEIDDGTNTSNLITLWTGYKGDLNEEITAEGNFCPSVPMPFPAGTTFTVKSRQGGIAVFGSIMGWEE